MDSGGLKEAQDQSYSPGGANEPSVCCGDAALCQITLTTCLWSKRFIIDVI